MIDEGLRFEHWLALCQIARQGGRQSLLEAHQRLTIYHRAIKKGLSQEDAFTVAKRFPKKRLPKIVFERSAKVESQHSVHSIRS